MSSKWCCFHEKYCQDPDELGPKVTSPKDTPKKKHVPVYPEVIKDLLERVEMGRKKYGEILSTNNGRKALQDAYEEALDLAMYLKQRLMEDDNRL